MSDGQQFHQYQQNEQQPLTPNHWTQDRPPTLYPHNNIGSPGPDLGSYSKPLNTR